MATQRQKIGGQEYDLYSPAWQAAKEAENKRQQLQQATVAGTAERAHREAAMPVSGPGSQFDMSQQSAQRSDIVDALRRTLTGGSSSSGSMTRSGLGAGGAGGGVGRAPAGVAPVDTTAANAAIFARAKDQVGQTAQGALTGLRSALAGRGLLGSGAESRGTQNVVTAGLGELGDVSREQAIKGADVAQRTAETNYAGGLTQRGQDITMRGQDLAAQEARNRLAIEQAQRQAETRASALQGLLGALSGTKAY